MRRGARKITMRVVITNLGYESATSENDDDGKRDSQEEGAARKSNYADCDDRSRVRVCNEITVMGSEILQKEGLQGKITNYVGWDDRSRVRVCNIRK